MPIRVLDKQVAELIAAGEFIERPASVVKELMENSIDAGAAAVTVEISHGGLSLIRVTDNGCGIGHDEAPTAFLRHATSKIFKQEDLNSILTLGFRGEALASICAVAKVELLTKRAAEIYGTRVYIEGSEQLDYSEAGCADGTTVIVSDLFYNVPARLKFMKKDAVEAAAVTAVVGQTALSHPEISVKFIKDGRDIMHTPGNGKLLSAVYSVLGKDYAQSLMPAEYTYKGVRVSGFVSDPMHGRKSRAYQHFFVNGRYVKNKVATVAAEEAYKNSIMIGKFPAFVLMIELEADRVDVNVHPAKTEIRFTDEREVYDAVYFAVKTAVTANNSIKDIAVKEDKQKQAVLKALYGNAFTPQRGEQLSVSDDNRGGQKPAYDKSSANNSKQSEITAKSKPLSARIVLEDSGDINETATGFAAANDSDGINENSAPNRLSDSGRVLYNAQKTIKTDDEKNGGFMFIDPGLLKAKTPAVINEPKNPEPTQKSEFTHVGESGESEKSAVQQVSVIGEIFGTYILARQGDVFVIIDKHAAHERIIFESLKAGGDNASQLLLTPLIVTLSPQSHAAVVENLSAVCKMGFEAEDFGADSVIIRAVPTVLERFNIKEIIEEIADNLTVMKKSPEPSELDNLYHSVACKAAVRANDKNSREELAALADRVCNDEAIRYCPHGRPVLVTMTEYELKRKFGR